MSTILQIETINNNNKDIPGIPMMATEVSETLGNAVVYVDSLSSGKNDLQRKDFLNALAANGCDVDFSSHTFRISDLEMFTRFILNGTEAPKKELGIVDFARLMDNTLVWLFGHYPTVLDGAGYDNIFFAFRHQLYGGDFKADQTYRVVAVFYGKV